MGKHLAVLLLCLLCVRLSAQSTMQFLNVNPDAATSAVAGTGIARPATAYAIENNLAAAALSESRMAFSAGYGIWQPAVSRTGVVSAGGFFRIGDNFALAAGFKNFAAPTYSYVTEEGSSAVSFKPGEMAVSLGGALKLSDALSLGLDAKFARSSLADFAKASSLAADVSLAYCSGGFSAGLAVSNIGGKVRYSGSDSSYSMPMAARAGAAYSIAGFTASAEFDYLFSGVFMAGLGAEYLIEEIVALRAGYHFGDSVRAIPSYASAGLGVNFFGVSLNASYLFASGTLGGTMMFGLGYSF